MNVMTPDASGSPARLFRFLDALRAAAAWLVVWDHLLCAYPERWKLPMPLVDWVNAHVNQPLGIIQNFGWYGVCLFFLISGFVITHAALHEPPRTFIVRRLFRIYPMVAVALALGLLLEPPTRAIATPQSVLAALLLVNYWISPQVVLIGVAWTLAVEMLFYALILATHALGRRPALRLALLLGLVSLSLAFCREFGPHFFLVAATAAYLPFLLVGQLMYVVGHQRAVGVKAGLLLGVAVYAVMLQGLREVHTAFLPLDNSYLITFAWSLCTFLLAWRLEERLRPGRATRLLADTSYSLYLLHGIVGVAVLDRLVPLTGYWPALAVALVVVAAVVLGLHLWVERPLQDLGRRLSSSVRPPAA